MLSSASLGHLLYRPIFAMVRAYFRFHGVEIWARNSYQFRQIVPLLSDIDVSLAGDGRDDRACFDLYRRFERVKRLVPILGEANVYPSAKLEFVLEHGNRFELARDPILLRRLGLAIGDVPGRPSLEKDRDTVSACVFAARMLASDLHNLRSRPGLRRRKWAFHLRALGLGEPPTPFTGENLVRCLDERLLGVGTKLPIGDVLMQALRSPNLHETLQRLYRKSGPYGDAVLLLFFSEWMGFAVRWHEFGHALKRASALEPRDRAVAVSQIKWELACLCTQMTWVPARGHFLEHVKNVLALLRVLSSEDYARVLLSYLGTGIAKETDLAYQSPPYPQPERSSHAGI